MCQVILTINNDYFPEDHLPIRFHMQQPVFGEK